MFRVALKILVGHQLGPQQLKYITVRRDSSACLILSSSLVLAALTEESAIKPPDWPLICLEEVDLQPESLKDEMV